MGGQLYLGLVLLILVLGICIKDKKLAITLMAVVTVGLGALTLYANGIYADEMNLPGDIISTILFIVSVILLVIVVVVNQKKDLDSK